MGWVVVTAMLLGACGASRRALPSEDAGPGTDADSDVDSDSDTGSPACATDADGDRHLAPECGGDDCDDADPSVHPGASDAAWSVEEVTTRGFAPAIAIARDGSVLVAVLEDSGISLHRKVGSDWSEEPVTDRGPGSTPSIAVDGEGTAHIAWLSDADVRYANDRSGSFVEIGIDEGCERSPIVAVDEANAAYVAYGCGEDGAKLATLDGGGPEVVQVPVVPDHASWIRLACRSGVCHLAVQASHASGLRYVTNDTGSFRDTLVDAAGSGPVAIALDLEDRPVVAYAAREAGSESELRLGVLDGGAWQIDGEPMEPWELAVAVTPDGTTDVAAFTMTDLGFQIAWHRYDDAAPLREAIATGIESSQGTPFFAVDADGVPHVAYEQDADDFFGGVFHAWRAPDGVDQDCDGEDG